MEGNESSTCSNHVEWAQQRDKDAETWLWKLSNCFSPGQALPNTGEKMKDFMERKPTLELKDLPPPPPPTLHPCPNLFPSISQSKTQQTPLQPVQHKTGPKVSCCALCSSGTSTTPDFMCAGGSFILPNTMLDKKVSGTITCQITPGLNFPTENHFKKVPVNSTCSGLPAGFSSARVASRLSPCQVHPAPPVSCCYNAHYNTCHRDLHKFQVPVIGTSGYFPCSEFTGGASRVLQEHLAQSELLSHYCTSSLQLNPAPPVYFKGSSLCDVCLEKPSSNTVMDGKKIWPNIPPPSTRPVPLCNGCGTQGKEAAFILANSFRKASLKYGSSDLATAGQLSENLPPIGVFWDIENCSVPSGRSAVTVVKRIRERFFKGHREAEFICVCDISKENKEVIEELNNCQVTVAHINATAKNAADDKLRQSLRRFADTHTSPATVVLVSTDVNFALELSDLRHRHGFNIILVHKNQASEALLQNAHELIRFEEFISDLPPRLPLKPQQCHTLLYVYNLPTNRDTKSISNRLRRLSDNCGGKVMSISGGSAILRFFNQESAERAQKRMENEDVFGNRITVSFTPKHKEVTEMKNSNGGVSSDKSKSPKKASKNTKLCLTFKDPHDQSSNAKTASSKGSHSSVNKNSNVKSLQELCQIQSKSSKNNMTQQDKDKRKNGEGLDPAASQTCSPASNQLSLTTKVTRTENVALKGVQKCVDIGTRSSSNSPVERKNEEAQFQVSNPSAFSKLSGTRLQSPVRESQSLSLRNRSPNLSHGSSPFAANSSGASDSSVDPFANGADIQIGNLDYRMSRKELLQTLRDTFSSHGKIKHVELSPHTDYQLKATVQMETLQEAICAVSNLHRYKIGSKRIQVSLATGATNKSLALLSFATVSILQDAPACCLPLFKFTEIYDKKFGHKLIVSDLYRLTDTVNICDQGNGRLICLLPSIQARLSPMGSSQSHDGSSANCSPLVFEELEYHEPVCRQHCTNKKFSEHDFDPDSYVIPHVILSLKAFAPHVHSLLQTHEGTVPLLSFHDCYAAEFNALVQVQEEQGGVPLEHLITCIPGVNIATAQNGIKVVKWIHNKPPPPNADPWLLRSKSPVGNPQLIQFSREVIDLLKSQPSCIMPVAKFIPTYHHHFAKQCRVSDYGYSKLMELLEAVPHVLQILGMGSKRLLTLTHRAQVKRFTQDLLKLLKSQASKLVIVREFLQAYHWCFSRDWDVTEYGVCELSDIVSEIPDTTICVSQQDDDIVISIPKRDRTPDEVERTKQFAKEVVDLLRHQPHFRMPFNKFIPSYHHHFGRQCKLTYYGFTKLLDLFEAIPDVLHVQTNDSFEDIVTLTPLYLFAKNVRSLLHTYHYHQIFLHEFSTAYSKYVGEVLQPKHYSYNSLEELLAAIPQVVWIKGHGHKRIVVLKNDMKVCHQMDKELLTLASPVDLMCEPVPSSLPSPQLYPDPVGQPADDLIHFEEKSGLPGLPTEKLENQNNSLANGILPRDYKPSRDEIAKPTTCKWAFQEAKPTDALLDSPIRKPNRNRVKLAANFSFAPVTKL